MRIPDETLPALGRLPLAREDVDRGCEVRAREGWLQEAWTRPEARVLWLSGRRAPVLGGQLVLARPEGDLPDGAVYLGRSAAAVVTAAASQASDQTLPPIA